MVKKKKVVYGIYSEDEGVWAKPNGGQRVFATREVAEKYVRLHVKGNDCEYWLEDGLISVYEIPVIDD